VSTLAGNGTPGPADGPAGGATVDKVWGVASDGQGNVYYTDVINNSIRKLAGGTVTTLAGGTPGQGVWADGTGSAAVFANPTGIVADNDGNLYVSDIHNLCIRKITPAGVVSTIAGDPRQPGLVDGAGSTARFQSPYGITIDNKGNLYVADMYNNAIRKITRE
jgi:streptogramin lyase